MTQLTDMKHGENEEVYSTTEVLHSENNALLFHPLELYRQ